MSLPPGLRLMAAPPVYDLHQHLWPPALVELLRRRARPPFLREDVLTTEEGSFRVDLDAHVLASRLAALDQAGIDVALVSLQPTLGFEQLPHDERREIAARYHEGIDELVDESGGRIRALACGVYSDFFAGSCVGASRLLDPVSLAEVLDPLQDAGGILFVHPDRVSPAREGAPGWWRSVAEYPADMLAAYLAWIEAGVPRWPTLRVVFALLAGGAAFQLDRLASRDVDIRRFADAPVFFETSSSGRPAIELSIASFGLDRIVHGSDYPVIDPGSTMAALRSLGDAVFQAVAADNPRGLLGREDPV